MSRTTLASNDITIDGVDPDGATPDAVNGNDFGNNGRQMIAVFNGDGSPHTLTIQTYPKGDAPGGLTVGDKAIVIAAGTRRLIGPFPPSIYGDATNKVQLDWTASTSMKVKVLDFAANPG